MRDLILPEPHDTRLWLTTADVAGRLGLSTAYVRRLASRRDLPCEISESGQYLFRRGDIKRILLLRNDDRARPRAATLALVRVRMLKAELEPRQLSLVPLWTRTPRLRLAASGERSVADAQPKGARSFDNRERSEKPNYVNQKSAGARR